MRVLILVPYYKPESAGPVVWIEQLALDLKQIGHEVTVLTAMPHFPDMVIQKGYRRKLYRREIIDGVTVHHTWIYASAEKSFWRRALNWGSFCLTSLFWGLVKIGKTDVIFDILWPLPLGVTGRMLGRIKGARLVVNVQDMYPDVAVSLGLLRNRHIIRFFQRMEKWIYDRSDRVVVISEGFRENLLGKGVPDEKIAVVPNWADPDYIRPGPRENSFRDGLHIDGRFALIYSGGLGHNTNLEPLLGAADSLRHDPFAFIILGEGVHKAKLQRMAAEMALDNVRFGPFEPIERYAEVLRAADMNLVTLNNECTLASVPSKVFKQMAAGRPVLAITAEGSELHRMVTEAECGLCVPPEDHAALADALRWAAAHPDELCEMGRRARSYLERYHTRSRCVRQVESILADVVEARGRVGRWSG